MKRHNVTMVMSVLVLWALVLSACQPLALPATFTPLPTATPVAQAAAAPQPQPQGLRPDAPEYGKHGPFWVGYKPLVVGEGTAHKLDASLWYPALNPNGNKEEVT